MLVFNGLVSHTAANLWPVQGPTDMKPAHRTGDGVTCSLCSFLWDYYPFNECSWLYVESLTEKTGTAAQLVLKYPLHVQ